MMCMDESFRINTAIFTQKNLNFDMVVTLAFKKAHYRAELLSMHLNVQLAS